MEVTDLLAANLKALAHRDSELYRLLSALPTEASEPVGAAAAASDNSAGDPWLEVAGHLQTIGPNADGIAVFVGLGMGYGPLLVLRERPGLEAILIVEPDPAKLLTAARVADLRPLLAAAKVHFFIGDDWLPKFKSAAALLGVGKNVAILRYKPDMVANPARYKEVDDRITALLTAKVANEGVSARYAPVMCRNRLANIPLLRNACTIHALRGLGRGMPVLLVGAGPSLTPALPYLRQAASRALIIAVDAALAPLTAAGIVPDFVVSVDFNTLNIEKVVGQVGRHQPFCLVVGAKVAPLIPQMMTVQRLVWAFDSSVAENWLRRACGEQSLGGAAGLPSGAHLALALAIILEADDVTLVGVDLAHGSGASEHAAGVATARSGRAAKAEIYVPGTRGGEVPTSLSFSSQRQGLEAMIAEAPGIAFNNASPTGAMIAGARPVELAAKLAAMAELPPQSRGGLVAALAEKRLDFSLVSGALEQCLSRVVGVRDKLAQLAGELKLLTNAVKLMSIKKGPPTRKAGAAVRHYNRLLQETIALNADPVWDDLAELTFVGRPRYLERERAVAATKPQSPAWWRAEVERFSSLLRLWEEAATEFHQSAAATKDFLEREQELLTRFVGSVESNAGEELLQLYAAHGFFARAAALLLHPRLCAAGERLAPWRGLVCAGLLDFVEARQAWSSALAPDPEVDRLRVKLARRWLTMERDFGTSYPSLVEIWRQRAREIAKNI